MKGFLFPAEVLAFKQLFKEKHPEFSSVRALNQCEFEYSGVYYHQKYKSLVRAFLGIEPIFPGEPFSPKPEKRNKEFIKLTSIMMSRIGKKYA
jgi:hypothetical protein